MLTHTTAWDQLLGGDVFLKIVCTQLGFTSHDSGLTGFWNSSYHKCASINHSRLVAALLRFDAKPLFLLVFYATISRPKIYFLIICRGLCWRDYGIHIGEVVMSGKVLREILKN